MDKKEIFNIKREVFRKWLEQFTRDEAVHLLSDVYESIQYKERTEYHLGRNRFSAN